MTRVVRDNVDDVFPASNLDDYEGPTGTIRIRALGVTRAMEKGKSIHESNTWEVHVPLRVLTENEREVIRGLFPNTSERAQNLLMVEALLSAVV